MSWNGYPKSIQNFLMKKLKTKCSDSSTSVTVNEDTVDNLPKIWIRIPYLGSRDDFLLKSCLNKVQRFLSKPVKFITIYDTKKLSYFVSNKDKLPPLSPSNVVYEVACPGRGKTYIGMTQRCLSIRLKEHATRLSSTLCPRIICKSFFFVILYRFLNQCFGNLAPGIVTFVSVYMQKFMLISATINKR